MILIVGLGNPGDEYKRTFHNAGFMTLDKFCSENGIQLKKNRCKSLIYEGSINGEKVVIAKPLTYMNNSGEAVLALKQAYKATNILIVYDDIDLPIGSVRFRQKGSSGSHNGMRSIVNYLKTEDFARIRVGIKGDKIFDLKDYVLSNVPLKNKDNFDSSIDKATNLITEYISQKENMQATSV